MKKKVNTDAMGNRISKTVINKQVTENDKYVTTYYVRDPQGNVLAVYERKRGESGNGTLTLTEQHLYGASRLGMTKPNLVLSSSSSTPAEAPAVHYELTNHLGNVLSVITPDVSDATQPAIESLTDYYPFGMEEPGRSYNSNASRFGYTGHEKENDLAEGVYTTQYRLLDTRLGRWMSVDPLFAKYPDMSAYNYCGGNPIVFRDPDGRKYDEKNERKVQRIERKVDKKIKRINSSRKISADLKTERVSELEKSKKDFEKMRDDKDVTYKFKLTSIPMLDLNNDPDRTEQIIYVQRRFALIPFIPRVASFLHESRHGGDVARGELTYDNYSAEHEVSAYKAEIAYEGEFSFRDGSKPKTQDELKSEVVQSQQPNSAQTNNSPNINNGINNGSTQVQTTMPNELYHETTIYKPSEVNENIIFRIMENNKQLYNFPDRNFYKNQK